MKILVVPASFKGTIKSVMAAHLIAGSIEHVLPNAVVKKLVIADGGEGTLEVFRSHFGCTTEDYRVQDPLGRTIHAKVGFVDSHTAIVESSQAIGFSLLSQNEFDPFSTSSYGVGQLIDSAVQKGARKILVTTGDSSTMDMGIGMLYSLGVKFYNAKGEMIKPSLANLNQIVDFDDREIDKFRQDIEFLALADTMDYLCGETGQVQLYGKQKGLAESDIPIVETAYFHFAGVIFRRFGIDVTKIAGATGSGGLVAALHTFLNAKVVNTLEYLSRSLDLEKPIKEADLVVTGEGCLDNQTKYGKVPYFVASLCSKRCLGIFGRYTDSGLSDMLQVCDRFLPFTMNPEYSSKEPGRAINDVVRSIFSLY